MTPTPPSTPPPTHLRPDSSTSRTRHRSRTPTASQTHPIVRGSIIDPIAAVPLAPPAEPPKRSRASLGDDEPSSAPPAKARMQQQQQQQESVPPWERRPGSSRNSSRPDSQRSASDRVRSIPLPVAAAPVAVPPAAASPAAVLPTAGSIAASHSPLAGVWADPVATSTQATAETRERPRDFQRRAVDWPEPGTGASSQGQRSHAPPPRPEPHRDDRPPLQRPDKRTSSRTAPPTQPKRGDGGPQSGRGKGAHGGPGWSDQPSSSSSGHVRCQYCNDTGYVFREKCWRCPAGRGDRDRRGPRWG